MQLLTNEIKKILPPLYRTENIPQEHKEIIVRFFNPTGNQSWEIFEGDETEDGDWRFFGNCDLGFGSPELGYVMLSELESVNVGFGLGIERDICVGPQKLHPEWKAMGAN
jgi:hypothetical protein